MSEKTGDFMISLASQAGVELSDEQKTAISEIATELPEGIATQIQDGLLTVDSAVANTKVRDRIKAEVFDAVDGKLKNLAMEHGFDAGFIQTIGENKETFKNIGTISTQILANQKKALEKAKEGAPEGDQKELQDEIIKLNAKIASNNDNTISKTDHDDTVEGYEGLLKENAKALLQLKANSLFANQNWAMDISPEANLATANGLFNTELTAKGIVLVEDNGILKLQTNEGTPYFGADNKEVTPRDFVKNLLSGHKLLKVTDTKTTQAQAQIITGNGTDASVASASAKAQESIDNIQKLQGQTA